MGREVGTWFYDAAGHPVRAAEFGAREHRFLLVRRPALSDLLADAVGRDRILLGTRMAAYTENETEIVVHLADGEELRADLLIGADGVYSRVRARLVPGSDAAVHAGHYAWRAMVPAGNERPEGTVLTVGRDGTRGGYARVAEGTTMWMINQFEAGPLTGGKRRAAHDWFTRELDARGGFLLVTTRFIPVGRYLATLSTGLVRYPLGKYLLFIAFATATWSAYTALTGYFGGVGFQENTPLAIAVGVGLAFVVTGVIEGVRRIRRGKADVPKAADDLQPEDRSGV